MFKSLIKILNSTCCEQNFKNIFHISDHCSVFFTRWQSISLLFYIFFILHTSIRLLLEKLHHDISCTSLFLAWVLKLNDI